MPLLVPGGEAGYSGFESEFSDSGICLFGKHFFVCLDLSRVFFLSFQSNLTIRVEK